ncbi:MAG: FG-GAP repeat domain-containing protein, partial [Solirubrobacteraceae bacterium]
MIKRRMGVPVLVSVCAMLAGACLPTSALAGIFNFEELSPSYVPPAEYSATSVLTGDFNRDGKPDIAFANGVRYDEGGCGLESSNSLEGCISVLLGNGDGTFKTASPPTPEYPTNPVNYPAGGNPFRWSTASLAAGDLTGNGTLDLVVANEIGSGESRGCGRETEGCVAVLYGNTASPGTFGAPVRIVGNEEINGDEPTIEGTPEAVAVGDFNGDGHPDIAVATVKGNGEAYVYILLYENTVAGQAKFMPPLGEPLTAAGTVGYIAGMTVANLTGHGTVDLAIS